MSDGVRYLRDLVPTPSERKARVLRAAVATLDEPPPAQDVVESYKAQHPKPAARYSHSSHPAEHKVWCDIRQRCSNVNCYDYKSYGGKGIRVHAAWNVNGTGFDKFMRHVGPRPSPEHALIRMRKTGNFAPGNVMWGKLPRNKRPELKWQPARYRREYQSWKCSRNRCTKESDGSWRYYGAIGIRFHEAWLANGAGFQQFMEDVGPCPGAGYALCRKDRNGHYEPGNVEWRPHKDVRVGVRHDRSYEREPELPPRRQVVPAQRKDCQDIVLEERASLIHLAGLTLSPNQADELGLALIRLAADTRRRFSL